jgi:hypothetical protein
VEGRAVFLDVRSDSYFALNSSDEDEFLRSFSEGRLESANEGLRRIFPEDAGQEIIHATLPEANQSLLEESGRRQNGGLKALVGISATLINAKRSLAHQSLEELTNRLSNEKSSHLTNDELAKRALTFVAARKLVPIKGTCLIDSLAMLQWLGNPTGVMLVFGVKMDPFTAHCWLQFDRIVLNERLESVSRFRPVRVV